MKKFKVLLNTLIFFILLFTILFIYILSTFKIIGKESKYDNYVYDIIKKGKTGDVLLTSYSNSCHLIKFFTFSKWSHTSMLYRDEKNNLYVLECGAYRSAKYTGVNLIPFNIWLKLNKNCPICWVKIKKEIENYKIYHIYDKYKKTDFSGTIPDLIPALKRNKYIKNENKSFFCSQFIMTILQDLNIINKKLSTNSFSPNDYCEQKFTYLKNTFNEPIFVKPI